MLEKNAYLDAFHRDAERIVQAAQRDLSAPVPSCPGWTIATLLTHLAAFVYAPRIQALRHLPEDFRVQSYTDRGLPPEFKQWVEAEQEDLTLLPPGLVSLFERTAADLEAALRAAAPEQPIRTWWKPQQNVGFLHRRMALETLVHRWDVQAAFGTPEPLEADLAADGVDEALEIFVPRRVREAAHARIPSGETYHFHRTDGPGEWLLRFAPGAPVLTREHAKGDIAIRGTAADLFLWIWDRIPEDSLEVYGDTALLGRFVELAPPI